MTRTGIAYTNKPDAAEAGRALGTQLREKLDGEPDAVVAFISPRYPYATLLGELQAQARPGHLVGASSAGEFTSRTRGEGIACAMGIKSDEMSFSSSMVRGLNGDRAAAAGQLAASWQGPQDGALPHRSALLLTGPLAGGAGEQFVDQLTRASDGRCQLFGGEAGAGPGGEEAQVFHRETVGSDAAVALQIQSRQPVGLGVGHGWEPASAPLAVTGAQGAQLTSLDGVPVAEVLARHAAQTGQAFDRARPGRFFLHNLLGVEASAGDFRLHLPLALAGDGSISCRMPIPVGATVRIMRTQSQAAAEAATRASRSALAGLQGQPARAAFVFDDVATRLRLGDAYGFELTAVRESLDGVDFIGCNTRGQIARAAGPIAGFHSCNVVVCVLPA